MDPSSRLSRVERDPRSDTQQVRDDREGQGQWEHQDDNTGRPGGESYAQQARFGKAAYGESDTGPTGLTGTTGAGDRYDAPDRQYAPETLTSDQSGGRPDPSAGAPFRDDDDDTAGTGGRASMASKVKGTAEKMAGKVTGDPGKQARGQERQEGLY